MTITLRAGVVSSGIQQNGTEFLTVDSSNNVSLTNNLAVTGTLTATGASTFTGAVTTPLSYVRVNTTNGYGSTNTKIRRFTNIVNNVGTDITYADSATLGGTFTINTNGVYSASYGDQFTSGNWLGLTIDASGTIGLSSLAASFVLAAGLSPAAHAPAMVSATFYATAGMVIRAHTDGTASGASTAQCQFTIARVQ
jgi:hypothetical protein